MAQSFLTVEEFSLRVALPREFVAQCEQAEPGWVQKQLEMKTAWIISRLAKRYGPFEAPYPEALQNWLTALVTVSVWLRRGRDPEDAQAREYKEDAETAKAEIKEAADAVQGLFELPLRADTSATGVSRGGPYSYSEQSPYVGFDIQREIGRGEDESRGGSFG